MSTTPRTLADQLRSWPAERLARLLEARPDLASPAPRDSAQLAARAVVRTSVLRALEELDTFELAVLEAVVLGGGPDVRALQGELDAAPAAVAGAIDRLTDRALVWGTPDQPRPTAMVAEILALPDGPPVADVPGLVAEVDDRARALLEHLDASGVDGVSEHAGRRPTRTSSGTPVEQLLARRLLVARDDKHVALPWTVRLSLRGGHSTRERVDVPPSLAAAERDQGLVDRIAAGAAFELVRRTGMLLEHWGTQPPAALRAGGLGVRDLKAAGAFLHADPDVVVVVVETAASAGLLAVGTTDELDSAWLPTDAFDAWAARPAADQWTTLARAWLDSPRVLPVEGGPADARTGRPANALAPGLEQPWVPRLRRSVLATLAELPAAEVLAAGTGIGSLVERLRWRHPRRPAGHLAQVEPVLRQAAVIGLVALDGLASFGRTLTGAAADAADPAGELAPLLPQPVDHLLLQADLTAIAPGPLERALATKVNLLTEVESRGGASVHRFTAASVRRAFDAGWSAEEVHSLLAEVSTTPVPQALTYLVDDVARRFGTVRAGHAESFLRSDDEVALAALVHDPRATGLRLRRIAPTVVVSDVPLQTLLPRLRELGTAPVVEAPDGTVHVARPDVFRSRAPRIVLAAGREQARRAAQSAAVVTAVRSGDRAAAERPRRGPASTPADVVTMLREAIEGRGHVLIGYLDNHGVATERRVRPERVEGGRLTAYDERADDVREFAIHRITTATPLGG